jgi:glycosyltransferase involved in cell wall biosynthesis
MNKMRKLDIIINAFSKIKENSKNNFKLLIVGDGNGKTDLEKLSVSLGLENDVIFTGEIPYFDVPSYIAASDICLCPVPPLSIYKVSSPTKLFEYMAMKKPIIANEEIPEQKEVIEKSGGGLLVKFDAESFAQAIIILLDDKDRAEEMGKKGFEWVVKNRSYENMAIEVERRYYEILKRYKKKSS